MIKEILVKEKVKDKIMEFKKRLNGSITNARNNEVPAIIVTEKKPEGKTLLVHVPPKTNAAVFANICRNEVTSAENLAELFKKNHAIAATVKEQPSGKLIVLAVGKKWIFAALVGFKSDAGHVFVEMEKTAKELEEVLPIQ